MRNKKTLQKTNAVKTVKKNNFRNSSKRVTTVMTTERQHNADKINEKCQKIKFSTIFLLEISDKQVL